MTSVTPSINLAALGFVAFWRSIGDVTSSKHWWKRLAFSITFLLVYLYNIVYLFVDSFTGNGLDETVFYHLEQGMDGAGVGQFRGVIVATLLAIAFGVVLASAVLWDKCTICQRQRVRVVQRKCKSSRTLQVLAYSIVLLSVAVHPLSSDLLRHYAPELSISFQPPSTMAKRDVSSQQSSYQDPKEIQNFHPQKNLVYIYMEGLERTYFDPKIFPDVAPRLRKWESSNDTTSFTNLDQFVLLTGMTIGGIVASQCGMPLITTKRGNDVNIMLGEVDTFLPGVTCLGDLMKGAGYHQTFVGGANLAFAGKGLFLKSHGFDTLLGKEELIKEYYNNSRKEAKKSSMANWGFYDDIMLDIAFERYKALSASKKPFGLYTLTLDTHDLHPSATCQENNVLVGDKTMLDSVRCTDYLVDRFLRRVVNHDDERGINNTLIVVGSDHLHMGYSNINKHLLEKRNGAEKKRRNTFFVLDKRGGSDSKTSYDTPGTTFDVSSTILSFLGHPGKKFGLGRDLTSGETIASRGPDFAATLTKIANSMMQNSSRFNEAE